MFGATRMLPGLQVPSRALHAAAFAGKTRMFSVSSTSRMIPDSHLLSRLPSVSADLFAAKNAKKLTFHDIGKALGRDEVAVAAIFYGQAKPSPEDLEKLSSLLGVSHSLLDSSLGAEFFPDRAKMMEMPPKDPLIYRLYEIVLVYGYAFKSIIHEKFGDGIMSAISFNTSVSRTDEKDGAWVEIKLKGKFLPYKRF